MRFRSIRDLVDGDSGLVLQDLKPVWLMSPLSVSDALPLANSFDVVIFDEASQVTLEEAVPAIFRARQVIVVGDEMQLPPTSFFASKGAEDEETLLVEDATGQKVEYDLSSNSLLNHAARNLPATMLGWHYRSRSESLISFSNCAFYQGRLLTVPEVELPAESMSRDCRSCCKRRIRRHRSTARTTAELPLAGKWDLRAAAQCERSRLYCPFGSRPAGPRNRTVDRHHRLFGIPTG